MKSIGHRLEQYTLKHPQEILLIAAEVEGETDQITVFKGFSSSLMRPTPFDPDVPMLPETAKILTIDRLQAPYRPDAPEYIQRSLTLNEMQGLLEQTGV